MQIAKKLSKLSNGNKPLAHLMAVLSDIYLCFGCFTYFSIIEFQIYFPVTTVFKFITNWPSFNCANRICQKEKKNPKIAIIINCSGSKITFSFGFLFAAERTSTRAKPRK